MKQNVLLPLFAVLVVVAAISGNLPGTVINGIVITGAMITAHVCALRAGRWRVAVFALIFTAMPVALALGIAHATQVSISNNGTPAFEAGQVTRSGLIHLIGVNLGFSALALVVDALAQRFLPR